MPKITSVKPQKNGKRVNVYLDGKFGFGIDLDNLVILGLKEGRDLSDEEIGKIVKKSEFQKALDKILKFATLRPRSEKEIKDWIKRKKVHESLHKDLFDRLKKLELIEDKKFAVWWVEQRQSFKPRGIKALVMELRQKGISKEIIEEVLVREDINEKNIAKELLSKNEYKWKNLPPLEAKQKKAQFLARKGLGWDTISSVLKVDPLG